MFDFDAPDGWDGRFYATVTLDGMIDGGTVYGESLDHVVRQLHQAGFRYKGNGLIAGCLSGTLRWAVVWDGGVDVPNTAVSRSFRSQRLS